MDELKFSVWWGSSYSFAQWWVKFVIMWNQIDANSFDTSVLDVDECMQLLDYMIFCLMPIILWCFKENLIIAAHDLQGIKLSYGALLKDLIADQIKWKCWNSILTGYSSSLIEGFMKMMKKVLLSLACIDLISV